MGCTEAGYAGSGPSVVIIGDSITHQARVQLHDALDDTHSVIVSGVVGATFAAQANVAEQYAADVPSVVVINLGTNDAWSAVPTTESVAQLDAMLAEFPATCAVLVTVSTRGSPTPTRGGLVYSAELANRVNEAVRARADVLVDWSAAIDADPARYLTDDGVHLTEAGNRRLSELVAEGVASCG